MSWWGFQKGPPAAMMIIVETPDDAAYTFSHPPGGPTSIGRPGGRSSAAGATCAASAWCSFPKGNYVDLAKRYRRYVIESGHFVPLSEKIARNPGGGQNLIGNPSTRLPACCGTFARTAACATPRNPQNSYRLTTFAEHIQRLRELKAQGWEKLNVTISGWPNQGYDRQHPDVLPPNKDGGGGKG